MSTYNTKPQSSEHLLTMNEPQNEWVRRMLVCVIHKQHTQSGGYQVAQCKSTWYGKSLLRGANVTVIASYGVLLRIQSYPHDVLLIHFAISTLTQPPVSLRRSILGHSTRYALHIATSCELPSVDAVQMSTHLTAVGADAATAQMLSWHSHSMGDFKCTARGQLTHELPQLLPIPSSSDGLTKSRSRSI